MTRNPPENPPPPEKPAASRDQEGGAPPRPSLLDTGGQGQFTTTRWSVVLAAANASTGSARKALEALCEKYWPPIYAFMRRQGLRAEDAQDLTQGFFASLLESESLKNVSPERGRFRSYLLAAAKNYLSSERKRARAKKRGSGKAPLSFDFPREEAQFHIEPADPVTPERLYERRWALALLDSALERLAAEACAQGDDKAREFALLRPYLTREEPSAPYAEAAAALGATEGAVKVAVHRLRKRFSALLRAEIAETLADPGAVDEEIQYLYTLFT